MAKNRSNKGPSAGMRKALAKADKLKQQGLKEVNDGRGELGVETVHHSNNTGKTYDKPSVIATSNVTGEIRTYPTRGSNRRFGRSVAEAESRGKAFIEAAANNDQGKLRGLYT